MASKISEAWYLRPLTIDTAYQRAIEDMVASPEDAKGKGIDLTLKCNGEAVDTTGCTVILGWRNLNSGKSNSRLFDAVSAASGRWKVTYPTEMLTPGVVLARVIIKLSATGSVITSSREFRIIVEHSITNDITGGSNDDLSMFQQAVADLTATNDAVAKAETKRVEAEQARAAAEQERLRAESMRIDNESTRIDSETDRTTAESERAAAEKDARRKRGRPNPERKRKVASGKRKSSRRRRPRVRIRRVEKPIAISDERSRRGGEKGQRSRRQRQRRRRNRVERGRGSRQGSVAAGRRQRSRADRRFGEASARRLRMLLPCEHHVDEIKRHDLCGQHDHARLFNLRKRQYHTRIGE